MDTLLQTVVTAYRSPHFRYWVMATVAGVWLSHISFSMGYGLFSLAIGSQTASSPLVLAAIAYPLAGLGMSLCQWFFLRRHFSKAYGWIVASVLGGLSSGILFFAIATPALDVFAEPSVWRIAPLFKTRVAEDLAAAICSGLAIGFAQYLFFKRRGIAIASGWIVASILARAIDLAIPQVGFPDLVLTSGAEPLWVLYPLARIARTCLKGVIYGAFTGVLLVPFIAQIQGRKASFQTITDR